MRLAKWIIGAVAFFVIVHLMTGEGRNTAAIGTVAANGSGCRVTLEKFSELKTQMPYSTVENILGCPGKELSRSELAGYTTVMLGWDGAGSLGANMNAMFQNNSLVSKAQFGLR
jgi:hypothetical protein